MKAETMSKWEENVNLFGIFRTVAYIGDSLSSGEVVSREIPGKNRYHDYYEYSWGQYLARKFGHKAYNFSRGGMTAKEFLGGYADQNRFFDPARAAQAYFIALGVNDLLNRRDPVGEINDVDLAQPENNADTFAGWYGKIISKYKSISPRAKFFLVTMPREFDDVGDRITLKKAHRQLMYEMAKLFEHTYVIDLLERAPLYDEEFKKRHFMNKHFTPAGYLLTAELISQLTSEVISENIDEFRDVAFIGTDLYE